MYVWAMSPPNNPSPRKINRGAATAAPQGSPSKDPPQRYPSKDPPPSLPRSVVFCGPSGRTGQKRLPHQAIVPRARGDFGAINCLTCSLSSCNSVLPMRIKRRIHFVRRAL